MSDDFRIDIQLLDEPVTYVPLEQFPQSAGAECVFLGRTREEKHPSHGRLKRLSYECYEALAVKTLHDLAQQALNQYECFFVRVHHATGDVPPGAASVLVQVVCGHRGVSFEACRFLIDTLKKTVPIWKREQWEDGSTWSQGHPVQHDQDGQ